MENKSILESLLELQLQRSINKLREHTKEVDIIMTKEKFENSPFGKIYKMLTVDEKNFHSGLKLLKQLSKIKDFEEEMVDKYETPYTLKINDIDLYRDGGSISIEYRKFDFKDSIWTDEGIIINNGFNGDGEWYNDWPNKGGIIIPRVLKKRIKKSIEDWHRINVNMVERILK